MPVSVDQYDRCLRIAGDDGRQRCTLHTQSGCPEFTVDQYVIQNQVDKHGNDTRFHGQDRLSALAQCAGIDLHHHKRRQPQKHDQQILSSVVQRRGNALGRSLTLKI